MFDGMIASWHFGSASKLHRQGRNEEALPYVERALTRAYSARDPARLGIVLVGTTLMVNVALNLSKPTLAVSALRRALDEIEARSQWANTQKVVEWRAWAKEKLSILTREGGDT